MSVAERTRDVAREHPFLVAALRAGIVNHSAAAEFLDVDGETDAVATALRRFAESLPAYATEARTTVVTMHSGVGVVDDPSEVDAVDAAESTLLVGGTAVVADAGDRTAVVASGEVDSAALRAVLARLAVAAVDVVAAGVGSESLVVVVERRAGAKAVRLVEDTLSAVPE